MLEYLPLGDSAIIVKAGKDISPDVNATIRKLLFYARQANIKGVVDYIPTYNELVICYDPAIVRFTDLLEVLKAFENEKESIDLPTPSVISVPVCYGGNFGLDLPEVANHSELTASEVIRIHSSRNYLVYMLGFTPGFCYLGGMDQRIATPRKQTPRLSLPAGAVGIAGVQTGIYPIESPGGWQWIGQTPIKLFDPSSENPFLFQPGDYIQFRQIGEDEFNEIKEKVRACLYQVEVKKKQDDGSN